MPRKIRIDTPGAVRHVIVRGIERRNIFRDHQDRDNWLARLETILDETNTPCFAWALMSNHIHLLLRTDRIPLASGCLNLSESGQWEIQALDGEESVVDIGINLSHRTDIAVEHV